MKNLDYKKESIRGVIKQIMKARGLRTISLHNYEKWHGDKNLTGIHSLKIDVQNGYLYPYGFNSTNTRCGYMLENVNTNVYEQVFKEVEEILATEDTIPSNVKRNILVRVCR